MKSLSNLYKAGWVTLDQGDKRIIDNNELIDQKILRFREEEKKRQSALQNDAAKNSGEDNFSEGLDAEQLDQLTEDQAVLSDTEILNQEAAQEMINSQLADAQEQADRILDEASAKAQDLQKNAMEEGRAQGYDDAYQQGAKEAEALKEDLLHQKEQLEADYKKMVDTLEPEMVDALTQIYEHVFAVDLRNDKNIILHLLQTALSRLEPGNDFIVHVSPDDYDMIVDEKKRLRENITSPNATMEIIEDPMLKENECIIETDGGVFDCSIGVELEELSRKLKLLSFERKRI